MTRKEAIKWLSRIEQRYIINGDESYDEARKEALHMAIEALERKRGEWRYGENDIGLDGYWCTVCGEFVLWDYKGTIDFIHRYNYCPNCGADMRGDAE